MKISDRSVDVGFLGFMCASFTITLRQKPKVVTRSQRRLGLKRSSVLRRLRVISLIDKFLTEQ